jgi:predicted glycosyltransferase
LEREAVRIIFYCQHVWGVGHLFRTIEILKELHGHHVILVSGGAPVEIALPGHVRPFALPGLMMDRDYTALHAVEGTRTVQEVIAERADLLAGLFEPGAWDLFVVELYPFGRNAFKTELDPLLDRIRSESRGKGRVVCSLRDILVEKKDPAAYEERVLRCLNRRFDALLVHADPGLVRLDDTFRRAGEIAIPIVYTGFVTPRPAEGDRERMRRKLGLAPGEKLLIASAGGGKLGIRLLEPLLRGLCDSGLPEGLHVRVYTGPYMEEKETRRLRAFHGGRCHVERFASDFIHLLAAADISVSMGGYNTSMNILAAGVPAVIWPMPQDREQRLRAEKMAAFGAIRVLSDEELIPAGLAQTVHTMLADTTARIAPNVDLDGAAHTARWLERWMATPEGRVSEDLRPVHQGLGEKTRRCEKRS